MGLTELPFQLPGRVFGGPMPFSVYDTEGDCFRQFKKEGISVVVVLADEVEVLLRAKQDLMSLYRDEGFHVIHIPAPDFDVPERESLMCGIEQVLRLARAGRHVVIHCHAGIGRTGLFAALLARRVLGLSGEEAISWVRAYIPEAIVVESQRRMVLEPVEHKESRDE